MNKIKTLLLLFAFGFASSQLLAEDAQQKRTTFNFLIEEKITRQNFVDIQNSFSQYDKNSGYFRLVLRNVVSIDEVLPGDFFLN